MFTARNGEPAYHPNPADSIDDEADELAESLGCTRAMALRVLAWEQNRRQQIVMERRGQLTLELRVVISELASPGNTLLKVWALAYASGLAAFMPGAARCPAEKAEQLGVTRQDISHFIRRWKNKLGLTNTLFSRTETAAQNSRQARLKVLSRVNGANPQSAIPDPQ